MSYRSIVDLNGQEKNKIKDMYLEGYRYSEIGETLNVKSENIRSFIRKQPYYNPNNNGVNVRVNRKTSQSIPEQDTDNFDIDPVESDPELEDKFEYYSDGTRISEKVLNLAELGELNPKTLLEAHGFDPKTVYLDHAEQTVWGQKEDVTLHRSKVKVKPKEQLIDYEAITEWIKESVNPVDDILPNYPYKSDYLVIPLYDLHFGNMTLQDYEESISNLKGIIKKGYKEILIISGGDIIHVDNARSTTASGTQLETIDLTSAWQDAFVSFKGLIEDSLINADLVSYLYVAGNHDETTALTLNLALEQYFNNNSRLDLDVSQEIYKARLLGHNFIGASHGHKSKVKKYPSIFATEFAKMWGAEGVKTRECYVGHLHTEWSTSDTEGLMIRQMPTRNATDKWHKDSGFVTSHKRFMVTEYKEDEISQIYYI